MKLLLLKMIYWSVITTELKRNEGKLCELQLELGKSRKEEETKMTGDESLTYRKSTAVLFSIPVVIANIH